MSEVRVGDVIPCPNSYHGDLCPQCRYEYVHQYDDDDDPDPRGGVR